MIGPHALLWSLLLLVAGLFSLASGAFNWSDSRDDDDASLFPDQRPQRSRVGRIAAGVILTFLGLYSLVAYAVLSRDRSGPRPGPKAYGEGWARAPVKLEHGELLRSAAVAPDGSVVALTGGGLVERGGSWLSRLDADGKVPASFGGFDSRSVEAFAPGARAVAFDALHPRILLASALGADGEEQLAVYDLGDSGREQNRLARLAVPRPHLRPGVASTGNVALSVGEDGQVLVVGRADSPDPGTAQLSVFRVRPSSGVDADYGGLLAQLPSQSSWDRDLSLARGPGGELYVGACDGARTWLLRVGPNGKLDPTFGEKGIVALDSPGYSLVTATPSGLVVAGIVAGYRFSMRRVGYDGKLDEGFAQALRDHPLVVREGALTHVDGVAFENGELWVALDSFERATGKTETALARFLDDGRQVGPLYSVADQLPKLPKVAARGLWAFGPDGLVLAVEAGPALPAEAQGPSGRSDLYFRPLSISALTHRRNPLERLFGPQSTCEAPPAPASAQPPPAAAEIPAPRPAAPAPSDAAEFYSYTDHGVVHVVTGLGQVPAAYRRTAHRIR